MRSNRIKQGILEVLAFEMWTTALLLEHVLSAPVVAPNMGSNCYWELLLISDRLLLLRRNPGPSGSRSPLRTLRSPVIQLHPEELPHQLQGASLEEPKANPLPL